METNKERKIIEYDIIRVIAVILVVVGHCTFYKITTDYGGIDFEPNKEIMTNISKIIFRILEYGSGILYTFHMPLFFALSGALFKYSMNRNQYKSLKELLAKKGKRLIIPFIIVTLVYSTPLKYISGYYSRSINIFKDVSIGQILIQGNTHLWFLPTLFCIFVIAYIYIYTAKQVTAI